MEIATRKSAPITQGPSATKFRFYTEDELAELPAAHWLIDDVLPGASCAILFGAPGSAKSFLALDWALSIASGTAWNSRSVAHGLTVYFAAEGHSGLYKRIRAWKQKTGIKSSTATRFVVKPIQLHQSPDVETLLAELKSLPESPRFVVIDTLARCSAGADENSQKDMGLAIQGADRIRTETGATVLLVHHTAKGKASNASASPRGSGVLDGAADTVVRCTKSGDDVRVICNKQKDAAAFKTIGLKLVTIYLADGESCVLVAAEQGAERASDSNEDLALAALQLLGRARATEWQNSSGLRGGTFERVKRALIQQGKVVKDGHYFQLIPVEIPSASGQDFQPSTHPLGVGGGGNGECRWVH